MTKKISPRRGLRSFSMNSSRLSLANFIIVRGLTKSMINRDLRMNTTKTGYFSNTVIINALMTVSSML
jgi:hypothetical protein